jgi:hypothetical protein
MAKQGRVFRAGAVLLLLGALNLVIANPALGDHFAGATGSTSNCSAGNPGGINMTDGAGWWWAYVDLVTETKTALETARTNIYQPTDFTVNTQSPGTDTDMVANDQDYVTFCGINWDGSPNVVGATMCYSIWSSLRCNKHEVRYDIPDVRAFTTTQRVGLACHESGHAAGMYHRDNPTGSSTYKGCMYTTGPYLNYLSPHDKSVINANF